MRLAAVFGVLLGLWLMPAFAAAPAANKLPAQIPLSAQQVENFIASYQPVEALGKKYDAKWGDEDFTDPKADAVTQMRQQLEAHGALSEFNSLVGRYGFKGVEDWWSVAFSTMIAYGFGGRPAGAGDPKAEAAKSLAEIEKSPDLTPSQKAQYAAALKQSIASYEAMKPPPQNIAVVAPYRAKLKTLIGDKDE